MIKAMIEIATPLGISVHDHIIVGKNGHASMKGMKLILMESACACAAYSGLGLRSSAPRRSEAPRLGLGLGRALGSFGVTASESEPVELR
jgi:hypothetical protein